MQPSNGQDATKILKQSAVLLYPFPIEITFGFELVGIEKQEEGRVAVLFEQPED